MFSKLGKLLGFYPKNEFVERSDSIVKLATQNALNRRKNTRVKYPPMGAVGGLPKVSFDGHNMRVGDISTGGLCLYDDNMYIGELVGEKIELKLKWPDHEVLILSTIVGCNMERRHIQFLEIKPETFTRLSLLLKPGFIGTKFRRVADSENVMADEVWLGPTGESVVFRKIDDFPGAVAEIIYKKNSIYVMEEGPPVFGKTVGDNKRGQRIMLPLLLDILVTLANIKKPTDRILGMITELQNYLESEVEGG